MSVATDSEEYSLSIAIPAEYFFVEDLFIDLCRLSTTALRRHPAYSKYVVFILNFVVMGKPLEVICSTIVNSQPLPSSEILIPLPKFRE